MYASISLRGAALGIALAVFLGGTVPAMANQKPPVAVSVEATGSGVDEVVVSYQTPVTETQVRQDIARISGATGWPIRSLELERSDTGPAGLYSAQFATVETLDRGRGRLPVSPLVVALRRYGQMLIIFDVDGAFNYTGAMRYQDSNVALSMFEQVPGSRTFAFQVDVKNPDLSGIAAPGFATTKTPPTLTPGSLAPRVGLALFISLLVGWATYLLSLRYLARTEGPGGH